MTRKIFKNHFTKSNSLSLRGVTALIARLAAIFFLLTLSSCITKTEKYGYMFDMADRQLLEEGVSDKARVLKIMGSPTIISDLTAEETWIYYSEKTEGLLFFKPQITEREVISITFDNSEIVKKIENLDINNEQRKLQFSSNQTYVPEHKTGFFKSLFSLFVSRIAVRMVLESALAIRFFDLFRGSSFRELQCCVIVCHGL